MSKKTDQPVLKVIREEIRDYNYGTGEWICHKDRYATVEMTPAGVRRILDTCSYLLLPRFDESDGCIALTSRTNEEINADRDEAAARVCAKLLENGKAEIGYVEYFVTMGEPDRDAPRIEDES